MYRISELAEQVGLSRSTLLYYEKQGLLRGARQTNGYRQYSESDVQRLYLLRQLQSGGLTLKECKSCLDGKMARVMLEDRLKQLNEEICQKQRAHKLLSALLGEGSLRDWHQQTDQLAPDAYLDWLQRQGYDEQHALHLKWLSKDMNEHDEYMADFMAVFQGLERWGPGSDEDTLKALSLLPIKPTNLIDIGCGKGLSTRLLAEHTNARIVALDNEQSALDDLGQRLAATGLDARVTLCCASMTELPFPSASFDCIWSEASAYIMGVEKALDQWQDALTDEGYMVISDLVWLTDKPCDSVSEFWNAEYPDMQTVEHRLTQIHHAGFEVIDHFTLSKKAWDNYSQPLQARVAEVKKRKQTSMAIADLERELSLYERHLAEFGYHMFVLRRRQ